MKYLILLGLIPAVCFAEVHYNDQFVVKSGFYKGCVGRVIKFVVVKTYEANLTCGPGQTENAVYNVYFTEKEIETGKIK